MSNSCQCGLHSRGLGRHVVFFAFFDFFAPKDVQLVGRGAGLRVADLSRLKFIFINLSADLAESGYRLTALRELAKMKRPSRRAVPSWHRSYHGNACATKHREYNYEDEIEGTHGAGGARRAQH